jgi:iron complex transport system substrate-binding protein
VWRNASFCSRGFFILEKIFLLIHLRLKIFVIGVATVLSGAWAAHCTAGAVSHKAATRAQDATKPANKAETKIVTDETGRQVAVPVNVQRIVSLAPNLTETLYALGLEDKLAGDTIYCDTPSAAKEKPHVGAPVNPSLEAIVALHPDLVLATAINRWETVDALTRLGIAVYSTDPHTVRDMLESTTLLGNLMGVHEQGAALVAKLQLTLDELQTHLREKPLVHVLFVVWEDPLITIGQNTFIADALRYAGAESVIISKQDWPQISMEEVLRLEPEYIVLTSNHSGTDNAEQIRGLRARAVWNQIEAVKLGRVVVTDEEVTRPSPGLVETIVQLAHGLHPEIFGSAAQSSLLEPQTRECDAERLVACAR